MGIYKIKAKKGNSILICGPDKKTISINSNRYMFTTKKIFDSIEQFNNVEDKLVVESIPEEEFNGYNAKLYNPFLQIINDETKDIVFNILNAEQGIYETAICFPYDGMINNISANVYKSSGEKVELSVEKINEDGFISDGNWESLLNENLVIEEDNKLAKVPSNELKIIKRNVDKNDYFRINIASCKGGENITIQLNISI